MTDDLTAGATGATEPDELARAIEAMREKYRVERDKRLRAEGNAQYVVASGKFAAIADDPFTRERPEREPRTRDTEVVIVGGGFGGLLSGARLRQAGVEDICIIDDGAAFGGTWYWNQYPGAQCDIESYIYLPMLEEVGAMPSEKYPYADEIQAHCRAIAERYGLNEQALFQTRVQSLRWDEATGYWDVRTDRGDAFRARYAVVASGGLTRPKLPAIPGIDTFGGHLFHTSRWDYDYTKGDRSGNLTGLADKRVAVIGTGATAVQVVPHVAASAKHLSVFQRTPSTIDVRANRPTDEEWYRSLEPGWQRERIENFTALVAGFPQKKDLVADGWTDLMGKIVEAYKESRRNESATSIDPVALANYHKMEEIRARVGELVEDPDVAEALRPYYQMFCKRPCFHDEYLQTFNRDNVTLVDTAGRGVERVTENSVVVDGVEHEVDCIILATGFYTGFDLNLRTGLEIIDAKGQSWSERPPNEYRSLHGIHVADHPNFFMLSGPQSVFVFNYAHLLDEQAQTLAAVVGEAQSKGATRVQLTEDAGQAWVDEILNRGRGLTMPGQDPCTPGYYNNEGVAAPELAPLIAFGGGPVKYFRILREWRESGEFDGLSFEGNR